MFARAFPYLVILRPHNMLAAAFAAFTGFHAAGGRGADGIVWLALLCAITTGAGNVASSAGSTSPARKAEAWAAPTTTTARSGAMPAVARVSAIRRVMYASRAR